LTSGLAGVRSTQSAPRLPYLNFFILIVQAFQKVSALKAMAPTQSEPPFVVAQVVALVMFGIAGTIRFYSDAL
jgi:hypothetical protein